MVAAWIRDSKPRFWATVHFQGRRLRYFTSNIFESLTAWILEAREKPIILMMEHIRRQLMIAYDELRATALRLPRPLSDAATWKVQKSQEFACQC